jgi:D-galactarolactone cycloisomerase
MHPVFVNPPRPIDGFFDLPSAPGLGLEFNESALQSRRIPVSCGADG